MTTGYATEARPQEYMIQAGQQLSPETIAAMLYMAHDDYGLKDGRAPIFVYTGSGSQSHPTDTSLVVQVTARPELHEVESIGMSPILFNVSIDGTQTVAGARAGRFKVSSETIAPKEMQRMVLEVQKALGLPR